MKSFLITDTQPGDGYNAESVDHAIRSHNRWNRGSNRIGKREAQMIHALLKGRESRNG